MIFKRKPSPVKFAWHRYPPSLNSINWSEADIQSWIVKNLRDWQEEEPGVFEFEAGMEGIKLTPRAAMKAKSLGMGNGFTDLKFYLSGGRMCLIELKRKKGVLTGSQKERHPKLAMLGFTVHVVKATTPSDGLSQVLTILRGYGV
ncbi:hypothetical protein LZD49_33545 [Dyadobacter sp. CY261]|uniref:hypothetical protein n=1 Tax=Dyadobacter sp. CY261 TaxID=2907203 RepID=UPI001F1D3908|nr:hypothetical protein [Dyadobacter sp. CY261]MCF0075452.1 hypothetical protein [Dyadobacter sp. CY261]